VKVCIFVWLVSWIKSLPTPLFRYSIYSLSPAISPAAVPVTRVYKAISSFRIFYIILIMLSRFTTGFALLLAATHTVAQTSTLCDPTKKSEYSKSPFKF
jgi:hypothetical protein